MRLMLLCRVALRGWLVLVCLRRVVRVIGVRRERSQRGQRSQRRLVLSLGVRIVGPLLLCRRLMLGRRAVAGRRVMRPCIAVVTLLPILLRALRRVTITRLGLVVAASAAPAPIVPTTTAASRVPAVGLSMLLILRLILLSITSRRL